MPLTHCPGVLAIELAADASPSTFTLSADSAAMLAERVADDLRKLLPGVEAMGLSITASLMDQAQILRPAWPVFEELAELYEKSQAGKAFSPGIVAFGSSAGAMPTAVLEPEKELSAPGALLCIPWVLVGDSDSAQAIGQAMETVFDERGLVDAATALILDRALSCKIEHARYLTLHDLAAMTSLQLEQAGFAEVWQLIEAALFEPSAADSAVTAIGQPLKYQNGEIYYAAMTFQAWSQALGKHLDLAAQSQSYIDWILQQRQFCAMFQAHGLQLVALIWDGLAELDQAQRIESPYLLCEYQPISADTPVSLQLHHSPILGHIGVSVHTLIDGKDQLLAEGLPLNEAGQKLLQLEISQRFSHIVASSRVLGYAQPAQS